MLLSEVSSRTAWFPISTQESPHPVPFTASVSNHVSFYNDRFLQTSPLPSPDTPTTPLFDQGPVRLALMTAGSVAVGGTAGYFVSKAAGWSLKAGAIGGGIIGMAIPIAIVAWALHKMN